MYNEQTSKYGIIFFKDVTNPSEGKDEKKVQK